MALRCARYVLLVCLAGTPSWALAASDSLDAVYSAILRGDYEAGHAQIQRLLNGADADEARQVSEWLEAYHEVVASRAALKAQTLEWNVEQAHKALEQNKLYLALTFIAAQAVPYVDDEKAFAQQAWLQDLTKRCLDEARKYEQEGRWIKALSYYTLLLRIHEDDKDLEKLHEDALRHARIEALYKDEDEMREHIKDVNKDLLINALRLIDRLYYEEPDFKKAALGAIDNLLTLCETSKLHEFLDGMANPALCKHFVHGLQEHRREIEAEKKFNVRDLRRLFHELIALNGGSIEIPEGLLVVEFVEGVRNQLDDYTNIYWPSEAQAFEKSIMGGFEGVGIQLGMDERSNRLKVITPLENSPALEAGIQPDDLIVAVNGESTKGWDTDDAVQNISGPAGTEVILTMFRPSSGEELAFKLVRRHIVQTSVRGVQRENGDPNAWNYMLDKNSGVAYIRLTSFLPSSHTELDRALREARQQGMKGLILDVRHNPGGLLDVAIDAVSNFLARGEVVSTEGRVESERLGRVAAKRAEYKDVPLVVLVNGGSASGSEILAGALQDHGRAIVLGQRTFGKGSVQHIRMLGNDARLRLTTALYYLPSGRTPHKRPGEDTWGIEPDWQVELTPKEFRRVLEQQRDTFIIHNETADSENKRLNDEEREKLIDSYMDSDEDDADDPPLLSKNDIKWLDSDPHEAPDVDPQLQTALLLIRVKLAAEVPWPPELASAIKDKQP